MCFCVSLNDNNCSERCVQEEKRLAERSVFLKTVLWGEVVGCIVLGSYPKCQMTIQLTVFPEATVKASPSTSCIISDIFEICSNNCLFFCCAAKGMFYDHFTKELKCYNVCCIIELSCFVSYTGIVM